MSVLLNLSVVITFLFLAQIFGTFDAAVTNEYATNDTDFTFLISGGYRPPQHTLTKYAVSIQSPRNLKYFGDTHFCGGSIIGPRIILTAAHCLTDRRKGIARNPRSVLVVAKTTNRLVKTDDTVLLDVQSIRVHPRYSKNLFANDIAILELKKDIIMDGRLAAIIPLADGPTQPGTSCTVVGWGRILKNGPLAADAMYINININEDAKCKGYRTYRKGMMCASDLSDPEFDTCSGDSGGPLICELELVGIVSYGGDCAGLPGVYTDVWFYRQWIKGKSAIHYAGSGTLILVFTIMVIVL